MPVKLTAKQEKFTLKLFEGESQRDAYRFAFSTKNMSDAAVDVEACRLAASPNVALRLSELKEKQEKRTEITADRVIKELGKIAFGNLDEFYDDETGRLLQPHELSERASATLSSFKSRRESNGTDQPDDIIDEYKRYDKTKALELLGKHFGIFTEKIEHSGTTIQRVIKVNPSKKGK